MSDVTAIQNQPEDANATASSERPSWLVYVEERIEEEEDEIDSESPYYDIVRHLLLSSDDDDIAVPKAIQRFYDEYVDGFSGEDFGRRQPPEYGAGDSLNSMSVIVFELMEELPFTDPKQDRLAKFLIGLAKNAAPEFDKEASNQSSCWAIQAAAAERWNACHDRDGPGPRQVINTWLGTTALLAKLFRADLLEKYGPLWASADFERAFETHTSGDVTKHPIRQAQILGTANYVLIAGEAFAEAAKAPQEKNQELDAAKWKLWASKLQEVADAVGEDAEWNLKHKAQEAHDKMVELYPEAFEQKEEETC
ncbi:hypothetical protein F66182_7227 [Fusarium sp. NRRL 66182]|nr:hypothetical protein F66182_7227 [Fusarium sp. NRRL 66182]